jgi:ABC-2 type transport system ATP-binding protein
MIPYIQFSDVTKRYGSICALNDVSLDIARGEVLAVLGPNGAGKSTLFGCLLGFTWPTSGTLRLEDRAIIDADRTRFGYVAERVSLYSHRTVMENAAFFGLLQGHSRAEAEHQLERVGLHQARERKVRQLSKGMLQRLGLAIGLCGKPDLLVLDEPFNGLDPALLETVQGILAEESARGATILISTHSMSAVEPLATHIAILLEGRLAASGSFEQFRADHGSERSLESIYHEIACGRHETCVEEALA